MIRAACLALAAAVLAVTATPAAAMQGEPAPRPPSVGDDPRPVAEPTSVIASYYGPGLWGNRTACGQILTADLLGVAHRSLPCGSLVTLRNGDTTVVVPVVDRGPFHFAREFDLTVAAKSALACRDLCTLFWMR